MKTIKLINKDAFILFVFAFLINFIFLYFNYSSHYYDGYKMLHGEIAYNILKHGSTKSNEENRDYLHKLWRANNLVAPEIRELLEYSHNVPTVYPTNDIHIGYSLVMALVWFFTGTFRYFDVLLLQILIFSLLMFLWYQIAYFFFEDRLVALCSGVALLAFFPIVFLNVHVLRDVWPYYGIVVLLYGILAYLYGKIGIPLLVVLFSFFSICQFIRPPIFAVVITLLTVLVGGLFFKTFDLKKVVIISVCLLGTNVVVFWLPYVVYNEYAYGHLFVGPVGQNLLEGLGEFSNPWGYKLEDAWFSIFIRETYGLRRGTQEADDKAKELAYRAIREKPLFYLECIVKRLHRLFLPALSWFQWLYNDAEYDQIESFFNRVYYIFSHLNIRHVFIDFIARHIYIRLFLLIGYIGMVLALIKGRCFAVALLLIGIISSSYSVVLSHVEHRYLVPTYSVFSFFVGYFFAEIIMYFKRKVGVSI